jgi:predicted NAD/FAD-dependent oxidoreductase
MAAWVDAENIETHIESGEDTLRLVDGPETIAGWLEGIDVVNGVTVTRVEQADEAWHVHDDEGNRWVAAGVIVTAPLPQLHRIMPEAPEAWSDHPYRPTWSVVLASQTLPPKGLSRILEGVGLEVEQSDGTTGAVVHFSHDWSATNLEAERTDVVEAFMEMTANVEEDVRRWLMSASCQAHRWRYGRATALGIRSKLPRLVEAGDAWAEPAGTGGAALRSGAWAAAHIAWQCSQHLRPTSAPVQQTLF